LPKGLIGQSAQTDLVSHASRGSRLVIAEKMSKRPAKAVICFFGSPDFPHAGTNLVSSSVARSPVQVRVAILAADPPDRASLTSADALP